MSYYDWSRELERGSIQDDMDLLRQLSETEEQEDDTAVLSRQSLLEQVRRHLTEYHKAVIPDASGGSNANLVSIAGVNSGGSGAVIPSLGGSGGSGTKTP